MKGATFDRDVFSHASARAAVANKPPFGTQAIGLALAPRTLAVA